MTPYKSLPLTGSIITLENPEGPGDATYNFDGFGVAWYTDTLSKYDEQTVGMRPALYRTPAIACVSFPNSTPDEITIRF